MSVSIIVPVYNERNTIRRLLDRVAVCGVDIGEILVVDDGSTDAATVQKLASIDEADTRVFRTENRGLPAARNHGAAQARGELFCALDADDRRFAARLRDDTRVVVEPGSLFGPATAGFVRLDLGVPAATLREGVERLADFAAQESQG